MLCSYCLPYFVDSLLRTGTVRALQFIEGVPAREAAPHIIKRKGARMRSLTLLYHGRLFHCSTALAHAHSGDHAEISGHLGRGDRFERAIAAFAETYADQTGQDHAALVAAVQAGRISVEGTSPGTASKETLHFLCCRKRFSSRSTCMLFMK